MKKLMCAALCLAAGLSVFSQDIIAKKIESAGGGAAAAADNPTKNIKKIASFANTKAEGFIILFALPEIKTDAAALVLKKGGAYEIQSVELVDPSVYSKKNQEQLSGSLGKWKNVREQNIPDTVSGATKHSKKIYAQIRVAVAEGAAWAASIKK